MMQGDSYGLEIRLLKNNGEILTVDDVSDIEITIGHLSKKMSDDQIAYEEGVWVFPLSQKETFSLPPTRVRAQARIIWPSGDVEGVNLGDIRIYESLSREVL